MFSRKATVDSRSTCFCGEDVSVSLLALLVDVSKNAFSTEDNVAVQSIVLLGLRLEPVSWHGKTMLVAETDDGERLAVTVAVVVEDEVFDEDEVDEVLDEP